jgi:hypothetical protein
VPGACGIAAFAPHEAVASPVLTHLKKTRLSRPVDTDQKAVAGDHLRQVEVGRVVRVEVDVHVGGVVHVLLEQLCDLAVEAERVVQRVAHEGRLQQRPVVVRALQHVHLRHLEARVHRHLPDVVRLHLHVERRLHAVRGFGIVGRYRYAGVAGEVFGVDERELRDQPYDTDSLGLICWVDPDQFIFSKGSRESTLVVGVFI